jgi:hypothetical protein
VLRRLTVVTAVAAGMSIAAAITLATPALAKGPSQARITGSGPARAIVVSGSGEPGQQGRLATLAVQTRLFTVLFGVNAGVPAQPPPRLRTPPQKAALGPRYTIIYTVPGVTRSSRLLDVGSLRCVQDFQCPGWSPGCSGNAKARGRPLLPAPTVLNTAPSCRRARLSRS